MKRRRLTNNKKDSGLNITDWDARLFRIFEKQHLINWLTTKQIGLVKPSMWSDPFEAFYSKNYADDTTGARISLENILDGWFGQCWTLEEESDAMWRIYGGRKRGVRVATTIRKLFRSFYDSTVPTPKLKFTIGQVRDMQPKELETFLDETTFQHLTFGRGIHGLAKTLCIKRTAFSWEKEVRLLFLDIGRSCCQGDVVNLPMNPETVIDGILLDPRIASSTVQSATRKLGKAGYKGPIEQSALYQFEPRAIRLA